jgi:RNA polymerase sigma-70 factor (ECF subfamily)
MSITITIPEPALWIDRYGDDLYRFALSRVADEGCAEELVQATLLSALTGIQAFRGESSERTWLFLILRRKVIDHYRRQARHREVSLEEVTPDGPTESDFFHAEDGHWREAQYPASWQSADGALEQAELRQTLQRCQDKLPPQHGAVFVLRFVDEMTAEEVCKELNLTTSNYWVIVHRAKLQLRRCLEQQGLGRTA